MSVAEKQRASLTPVKLRHVSDGEPLHVFVVGEEIYVAAGSKEEALGWAHMEYFGPDWSEDIEARLADYHEYFPDWESSGNEGISYPMIEQARERVKAEPVPLLIAFSTEYL